MKQLILLSAVMFLTPLAHAAELNAVHASDIKAAGIAMPAPVLEVASEKALDGHFLCFGSSCAITTAATNVCSDGMRIVTEVNRGGYKDEDLNNWAEYQRSRRGNTNWRDPSHQNVTATGKVNPFKTAYVVVPASRRRLLNTTAEVCVLETGRCINAEVLEIGPAFGELSVGALMQLGLDAHPLEGRYNGRISYTFPN